MLPDETVRIRKVTRYTRLAIVTAFLLALLWPLGSFIIWICLGAFVYFIFLIYYYQPEKEGSERNIKWEQRDKQTHPYDTKYKLSPKGFGILFFLIISVIAIIYFFVLITDFINENSNATENNAEDAILEAQRVEVGKNPADVDALINLGNSFYSHEQYDSALKYYDRAIDLNPDNYSGMYNKALVYFQFKEYSKSIEILKRCNSLYPGTAEIFLMLGDCYYSQTKYTEAMEWYKQAYDKGSRIAAQLNIMGYIYDEQKRPGEAIKYYKEALEQDSSLVEIYTRLAELEPARAKWYQRKAEEWK